MVRGSRRSPHRRTGRSSRRAASSAPEQPVDVGAPAARGAAAPGRPATGGASTPPRAPDTALRAACTRGRRAGGATGRAGGSSGRRRAAAASAGARAAAIARSKPAAVSFAASRARTSGMSFVPAADVAGRRRRRRSPPTRRRPRGSPSRRSAGSSRCCATIVRSERRASSRGRRREARLRAQPLRAQVGDRLDHDVSSWLRRNSVKRLRGWSRVVGMVAGAPAARR